MSIDPASKPGLQRFSLNGETMGTRYSALFYAGADMDEGKIATALKRAVDMVDNQMSTWKSGSDLNRLNAAEIGEWVAVPPQLMIVLAAGQRISAQTEGAFDMNVGAAVASAGFGAHAGQGERQAMPVPGPALAALELRENLGLVRKLRPVNLDLSGIAKGYGVDEMFRSLERFGIASCLVGIDGEMRAKGKKLDGELWAVALERPVEGVRDVMGVITPGNQAIATSGDYRHVRLVDGKRISHTIDPATGLPLANRLASVTVLSATCMEADALATALMVMGETKGPDFARRFNLSALFLVRDGEGIAEIATGPFFAAS